MSDGEQAPYRSGLATGVGVVLLAGFILALADVAHTGGAPLQVLGLWSLLALPAALGTGLVLAAGNATWGPGWVRGFFRRLREDVTLDRNIASILMSAAVLGGVLAIVVSKLAIGLVGDVQRKGVGALLLGAVVVALVPMLALGALPLHRVTRRIASFVPAVGPISRVVVLLLGAAIALAGAIAFVIFKKLDYKALSLGSLFMPAMMPVLAIVIGIVAYGPLSSVRERIPSRGIMAGIGALLALVLPFLALRGTPSQDVAAKITDHSYVGPRLIPILRKVVDRDHDGYSAFFGGPDCDDHNKDIRPGVQDIPDNKVDENCDGFDNQSAPTLPALAGTGSGSGSAAPAPATSLEGGDNVLVIFVDTLRADRMGYAGYQRDGKSLTPRIDAFAAQSVVFTKAYSQASNTPRSVPSFLSSRYPTQVKVDDSKRAYPKMDDSNELLFEVMKAAGFTTIGMSSHFYFCDRPRYPDTCENVKYGSTPMLTNATQGSDLWDNSGALVIYDKDGPDSNKDSAGPRIVEKTNKKLDELAASKQKFAMIVHLFEPHSTYIPHEGVTPPGAGFAEKYDYEIAFEDQMIGNLLDHLDKTGLAANTTVILMSDHGEAFGVHTFGGEKQNYHGMTLYNEVLHVPLVVRVPNNKPGKVDAVVQLIDLAPTITALFDVKPSPTWVGRSLVPALEGQPLPPLPSFAEMPRSKSWDHEAKSMVSADGKYHVFHRISDSRWEVYDLTKDPDERKNIVDSAPEAKQLQQQLASWAGSLGATQ